VQRQSVTVPFVQCSIRKSLFKMQ